jgi:hypothetical protein
MATADPGEDSRDISVGDTLHEAVWAVLEGLGEPYPTRAGGGTGAVKGERVRQAMPLSA